MTVFQYIVSNSENGILCSAMRSYQLIQRNFPRRLPEIILFKHIHFLSIEDGTKLTLGLWLLCFFSSHVTLWFNLRLKDRTIHKHSYISLLSNLLSRTICYMHLLLLYSFHLSNPCGCCDLVDFNIVFRISILILRFQIQIEMIFQINYQTML